jgi:hypothetical protein
LSHIDGQLGTIDLVTPGPSDWFKIGEAHGEQGWPQDPVYIAQQGYLEGYASGKYKRPFLFPNDVSQ